MKFLLTLFLLMCMILAFLYCCKKLGLDIGALLAENSKMPQAEIQQVNISLDKRFNDEYRMFAFILWMCLKEVHIKEFDISNNIISNIYCKNFHDRVKPYDNNIISFFYEVPLANLGSIRNGKICAEDVDYKSIEEVLREHLTHSNVNLFFIRNVYLYAADDNRALVEIYGVGRNKPPVGGIKI